MYKVYAKVEINRLYIQVNKIYRREVKTLVETIEKECKKLKKDFTCLTDLRFYSKKINKVDKTIEQVQKMLVEAGMKKVVRVYSHKSDFNELQLEAISLQMSGYSGFKTTSIKLAEELLDHFDEEIKCNKRI